MFTLRAQAGGSYAVGTGRLGGGMDTLLDLYDPRGRHLQRDDDGGAQRLSSRIDFTASETGTFFVVVRHYDGQSGTGTYAIATATLSGPPAAASSTPSAPEAAASAPASAPAPAPTGGGVVSLSSKVFDPKLAGASWAVSSRLPGTGSYPARVTVRQGSRLVATLGEGTRQAGGSYQDAWDGREASGAFAAPGSYTVRLETGSARHEATLNVVRLGVRSMSFTGSGRVPLAYHRADGYPGSILPVDAAGAAWTLPLSSLGADCLDRGSDGRPLAGPDPWRGVEAPPRTSSGSVARRGRSLPVAYVVGGAVRATVLLGETANAGGNAASAGFPVSGLPLRVVVRSGGGDASQEVAPGSQATLDLGRAPAGVGRAELVVQLGFQYRDGGAWRDVPGAQETRHTLYTVIAAPTDRMLPGGLPWVAALDHVATWSGGRARNGEGVLDACVAGVNTAFGLRYDVDWGAPAYTSGYELHNPSLDLDALLDGQANGRVVNCSDCAALVTKFAAQAGVDSNVAILGYHFDLNWLRGIGYSSFTHSLFGGSHGFSYHAVATGDRGQSVHDACLSVDADSRPWSAPHTEGLPQGMPYSVYRDHLTPDQVPIQELGRSTLR